MFDYIYNLLRTPNPQLHSGVGDQMFYELYRMYVSIDR